MDALKTNANGTTIFFEINPSEKYTESEHGIHETGVVEKGKLREALDAFQDAMETISAVAEGAVNKIKKIDKDIAPDEFELQFGIKLSAQYGAVLAMTGGEAQLIVKMTYKHGKSIERKK